MPFHGSGEQLVGKVFNPSGSSHVDTIKAQFADTIDMLQMLRQQSGITDDAAHMYNEAITQTMTAQMWAVKAITYRY